MIPLIRCKALLQAAKMLTVIPFDGELYLRPCTSGLTPGQHIVAVLLAKLQRLPAPAQDIHFKVCKVMPWHKQLAVLHSTVPCMHDTPSTIPQPWSDIWLDNQGK